VLSRYGIPADLARRTADVMVETDLCGVDSHDIAMLPWYAALLRTGEVHATARSHVLRETAVSAVLDAALHQIRSHADGGLTQGSCKVVDRPVDLRGCRRRETAIRRQV
jgi:LDH2 family malate/lactate/ureidoglycolate dehydrogenase